MEKISFSKFLTKDSIVTIYSEDKKVRYTALVGEKLPF